MQAINRVTVMILWSISKGLCLPTIEFEWMIADIDNVLSME